jgi:hypothetical protein
MDHGGRPSSHPATCRDTQNVVVAAQQKPCQQASHSSGATQPIVVPARKEVRRDAAAMLYWALRWHEGRSVSYRVLGDLLWGEFAQNPKDPTPSLRELMVYVRERHGDEWAIDDCGRGFRISPRATGAVPSACAVAKAPRHRQLSRTRTGRHG